MLSGHMAGSPPRRDAGSPTSRAKVAATPRRGRALASSRRILLPDHDPAAPADAFHSTAGSYRAGSARDVFITVYGRIPVLEALRNPDITVDKVLLADNAGGPAAAELLRAARARKVTVHRVPQHRVTHISKNGRQDQGVVADVQAPHMQSVAAWVDAIPTDTPVRVLVLDGVATPGNVGMIIRSATAAGIDQIVLPRAGTPDISPMVIKASAGIAFVAPILRCASAIEAIGLLAGAGCTVYGLRAAAHTASVFDHQWARRAVFVLGAETAGVSSDVSTCVDEWVSIPHAGPVESLNVAAAAAVICFELLRTHPNRRAMIRPHS